MSVQLGDGEGRGVAGGGVAAGDGVRPRAVAGGAMATAADGSEASAL